MTTRIALQRCWNHSDREAIARCPECSRSFCRECVVEHQDRLICNSCLEKLNTAVAQPQKRTWSVAPVIRTLASLVGLALGWFIFFSIGDMLLSVPEKWHDGTLWMDGIQAFVHDD